MFNDTSPESVFEVHLRDRMKQFYDECLENGVMPVLVIAINPQSHEPWFLHDTSWKPEDTLECLRDCYRLLTTRREGDGPTTD